MPSYSDHECGDYLKRRAEQGREYQEDRAALIAQILTDDFVTRVLDEFYGCTDHHFIERDGMRAALEAALSSPVPKV